MAGFVQNVCCKGANPKYRPCSTLMSLMAGSGRTTFARVHVRSPENLPTQRVHTSSRVESRQDSMMLSSSQNRSEDSCVYVTMRTPVLQPIQYYVRGRQNYPSSEMKTLGLNMSSCKLPHSIQTGSWKKILYVGSKSTRSSALSVGVLGDRHQ